MAAFLYVHIQLQAKTKEPKELRQCNDKCYVLVRTEYYR